jgi:hypothetical protein
MASGEGRLQVADLGAGNRRLRSVLERVLTVPFDYHAYDIRPQSEDVQRLDVQQALPDRRFDVVFCLGLLEYLRDPGDFAARLRPICSLAVVSYVITDAPDSLDPPRRRKRGWRTDLTRVEVELLFGECGYTREALTLVNEGHTGLWLWSTAGAPTRQAP